MRNRKWWRKCCGDLRRKSCAVESGANSRNTGTSATHTSKPSNTSTQVVCPPTYIPCAHSEHFKRLTLPSFKILQNINIASFKTQQNIITLPSFKTPSENTDTRHVLIRFQKLQGAWLSTFAHLAARSEVRRESHEVVVRSVSCDRSARAGRYRLRTPQPFVVFILFWIVPDSLQIKFDVESHQDPSKQQTETIRIVLFHNVITK